MLVINYSETINDGNNYMKLWKERLNSDGHRFHQYQQNEQPPLILTKLTEHKKTTYDFGKPSSGSRPAQKMWRS